MDALETIAGILGGRSLYHAPDREGRKFLVHEFRTESGETIKIKGRMESIAYGWTYRLHGRWDRDDPRGESFEFFSYDPMIPRSPEGVADYLARHLPTIGKKRAAKIVEHFGEDTLTVIKVDPDRLREVPGLTPRMATAIREFLESEDGQAIDPVAYASLHDLLSPIRPPRRVILSLLETYGSDAPDRVREHPYQLQEYAGVGWDRVDRLALDHLKYDRDGFERHEQAALEALNRQAEQGHTRVGHYDLYHDAARLLDRVLKPEAVESLVLRGDVIRLGEGTDAYYCRADLYEAEQTIARRIAELQDAADPIFLDESLFTDLEGEQQAIVDLAVQSGVAILAGVPGSGKSWTTAALLRGFYQAGLTEILLVAPTGKAAKRSSEFLSEALPGVSIECSTIHRALGISGMDDDGAPIGMAKVGRGRSPWGFLHDADNPLPYRLFVIEEASMGDARLMASLLEAIPNGARVLIVGDPYQLPSVGPGAVLRDLIAARVPAVVLEKPRRNSGEIARACYEIKNGRLPRPMPGGNWVHREFPQEADIVQFLVDLHINYVNKFGVEKTKADLQVVTPTHRKLLGTTQLNAALATILNANATGSTYSWGEGEENVTLRIGDKVIRNSRNRSEAVLLDPAISFEELSILYGTKKATLMEEADWRSNAKTAYFNDREYLVHACRVVNGDMGDILDIDGSGPMAKIYVRFRTPDRLCVLTAAESYLLPGYAVTVHKMQGSSYPWILFPLHDFYYNQRSNSGLWVRELVYTAFSRPTNRLITCGKLESLRAAISRPTIHKRLTNLADLIPSFAESLA